MRSAGGAASPSRSPRLFHPQPRFARSLADGVWRALRGGAHPPRSPAPRGGHGHRSRPGCANRGGVGPLPGWRPSGLSSGAPFGAGMPPDRGDGPEKEGHLARFVSGSGSFSGLRFKREPRAPRALIGSGR